MCQWRCIAELAGGPPLTGYMRASSTGRSDRPVTMAMSRAVLLFALLAVATQNAAGCLKLKKLLCIQPALPFLPPCLPPPCAPPCLPPPCAPLPPPCLPPCAHLPPCLPALPPCLPHLPPCLPHLPPCLPPAVPYPPPCLPLGACELPPIALPPCLPLPPCAPALPPCLPPCHPYHPVRK